MIRTILLLILAAFTLTGCLEYESRIKVRPDGSGILIETVKFNEETADFMRGLDESMADSMESAMFDEAKLRQKAVEYGQGVSYVSGKRIQENGKLGYVAVYAFTNIENLMIGQKNMTEQLPGSDATTVNPSTGDNSPADRFAFAFTKGSPSTLRIRVFPENELRQKLGEEQQEQMEDSEMLSDSLQDSALRMMKVFLEGMKMNFIVEVEGTIIETNASNRNGSAITLLGLDFDQLLGDNKALKSLMAKGAEMEQSGRPQSMQELKHFIKGIPGFKAEFDEVVIKFQD